MPRTAAKYSNSGGGYGWQVITVVLGAGAAQGRHDRNARRRYLTPHAD
jgi:hypothetical protein